MEVEILFYLAGVALLGGRIVFSSTTNTNSSRERQTFIRVKQLLMGAERCFI